MSGMEPLEFSEYQNGALKNPFEELDSNQIDLLPFKPFQVADQKTMSHIVSNFITATTPSISFDSNSKNNLGFILQQINHLKHTRGGRHTISGIPYEYFRIQIVPFPYE